MCQPNISIVQKTATINILSFKFHYLRRNSVDRNKYQIHIPLPPKIDPTVTMMQVEDKPDVTYSDVGGCKEQIEKLREVVETPLLHVSADKSCVLQFKTYRANEMNLLGCFFFTSL